MQPPFTMEQMIYKAKTAVMHTGLYPTTMLKWKNFLPASQTLYFMEAYDLRVRMVAVGMTGVTGYHGTFNITDNNDDSLLLIQASI